MRKSIDIKGVVCNHLEMYQKLGGDLWINL